MTTGLVAAPLAGLGAPTAQAAAFSCTFTGTTTALTPPIPPAPVTNTSGSYRFSGSATCNGTLNIAIVSSGTYQNTVCGTGTADGTATFGTGGPSGPIGYHIQFVAGVGVLTVTSNGTGGGPVQITPVPATGCSLSAATGFTVTGSAAINQ